MMLKKFLHKIIHIWDTYDKVSDIFVKPQIKFYFGKWTKFYGLPVWRRGMIIMIAKNHSQYEEDEGAWYGAWAKHTKWRASFLASCSKFGRLWRKIIKPTYELPIWMSFYYCNYDIIWKTKYDECRYEFPAMFCIVAFNICFAMYCVAPNASTDHGYPNNDGYWETILGYLMHKNGDFKDFLITDASVYCSWLYSPKNKLKYDNLLKESKDYKPQSKEAEENWNKRKKIPKIESAYLACRPEYIKKEYIDDYKNAVSEIKKSDRFKNSYFIYDEN